MATSWHGCCVSNRLEATSMKPLLRGYIHQFGFIIALIACGFLLYQSHGPRVLASNIVYSVTLVGLFGISALYHTPLWGRRAYALMRSIDHAAIFALIAGSATPICLLGIKGQLGLKLVTLIWIVAIVGMLIAIVWSRGPKWTRAILYVSAGWLAVPYLPDIKANLGIFNLWLLLAGGITYTLGALVYACKRPDPIPHIFGYHELFHLLVVIASAFHFIIIYNLTK